MIDAARAATLQTKLDALEAAELALLTGQRVAQVSYDGNTIQYTPAQSADLQRLIGQTRRELSQAKGAYIGPRRLCR